MAVYRKPRRYASYTGKPTSLSMVKKLSWNCNCGSGGSSSGPLLRYLTIVWVQSSGVPFNTSGGFIARLSRNGQVVATTRFDNFGVAVFNNIRTLTRVSYTLTITDLQGTVFRRRSLPAGIEAYAVIG